MKIRDFTSTLNFAITTLNDNSVEHSNPLISNFDNIMQNAGAYIMSLVQDTEKEEFTTAELNSLILDDYNKAIDETYRSTNVYIFAMKYNALKYLESHREEIPGLLQEIEERKMTYNEREKYTDNFHENLLLSLIGLKYDFDSFKKDMYEYNKEFVDEIDDLKSKNINEVGFKIFCDKYDKKLDVLSKKRFFTYAYHMFFGIEGMDENTASKKTIDYKRKNGIKDYISNYISRLEPMFKNELKGSIISIVTQLDKFGEISNCIEKHNRKMGRIALPGLQYYSYAEEDNENTNTEKSNGITEEYQKNGPKIEDLINDETLSKLNIDTLLRMNSFYNNRFAKVINDYSLALYVLDETGEVSSILDGEVLCKDTFSKEKLERMVIKYQTLILPIKNFYAESQRDIEETPEEYSDYIQKVELENLPEDVSRRQIVLELDDFADRLEKSWGQDYEKYFYTDEQRKDGASLKQDIFLINRLYNPVFLSYRFKNLALKSEYAYMHYLAEANPNKSLNFGVVLGRSDDSSPRKKTILLASDGGVNLPNRLHTFRREFTDFIVSYTGKPLVRVYEGFSDFTVGGEYISTQLLLPYCSTVKTSKQNKYLEDLKRGKLEKKGDKASKMTVINEDFIEHLKYCYDGTSFMRKHSIEKSVVGKNGKVTKNYVQPERYLDLTTGEVYLKREDGKLLTSKGKEYGEGDER